MKTIELTQGSPEWHTHRAEYWNASDAPAMMGVSPYKKRSELLQERRTGLVAEISDATQSLFNNGHRFEGLSRPIAEGIIGEDLFPVVGIKGKLSCSFDGITLDESIIFEHKSLNKDIRKATCAEELSEYLRVQMEQQLFVSDAQKCLFMASRWSDSDELIEEVHFWYTPDLELRQRILAGWILFEKDLADYTPAEVVAPVVAAPTLNLPAVSVKVEGSIALISNLGLFGEALKNFIDRIPEKPSTDQEFADCKAAIGKLQDAQDALDAAEANALGQIATFDEMRRDKALYFDLARTTRLALEKLVTAREAAIKIEITQSGKDKLHAHIAGLNIRLGKPYMPAVIADWAAAIKSKRTIASLQNAVDTLLAQKKIEASAIADNIDINLKSLRELAVDHAFLFSDTSAIVLKSNDDLINLINSRINEHKAVEAQKAEALRAKIAEEERIKAEAKARAEQAAITKEEQDRQASETAQRKEDARQAELAGAALMQRANEHPGQASAREILRDVISTGTGVGLVAAGEIKHVPIASTTRQDQTSAPTLTLGKIGTRLGFSLTADFLRSIGFEPAGRERSAVLYRETDWSAICHALITHINLASEQQKQAA